MAQRIRNGFKVNEKVFTPGGYPAVVEKTDNHFAIVRVEREGMPPYTRRFRQAALRERA